MAKYQSVNGKWPESTREGRDLVPTEQEAITGAKRLYRKAMGKAFKGKVKATSGRRYTWIRSGVMYVKPNMDGKGGWHEIVHGLSHYAARRLWGEAHGARHAFIERELVEYVMTHGFLEGKLKRETKPKPPVKELRYTSIITRIKKWETKQK